MKEKSNEKHKHTFIHTLYIQYTATDTQFNFKKPIK